MKLVIGVPELVCKVGWRRCAAKTGQRRRRRRNLAGRNLAAAAAAAAPRSRTAAAPRHPDPRPEQCGGPDRPHGGPEGRATRCPPHLACFRVAWGRRGGAWTGRSGDRGRWKAGGGLKWALPRLLRAGATEAVHGGRWAAPIGRPAASHGPWKWPAKPAGRPTAGWTCARSPGRCFRRCWALLARGNGYLHRGGASPGQAGAGGAGRVGLPGRSAPGGLRTLNGCRKWRVGANAWYWGIAGVHVQLASLLSLLPPAPSFMHMPASFITGAEAIA